MKKIIPVLSFVFLASFLLAATASAAISSHLERGSTGADVSALQSFLIQQGLLHTDNNQPTGYFGQLTQTAVEVFQSRNGLVASGLVGPATRGILNRIPDASSTVVGQFHLPIFVPPFSTTTSLSATPQVTFTMNGQTVSEADLIPISTPSAPYIVHVTGAKPGEPLYLRAGYYPSAAIPFTHVATTSILLATTTSDGSLIVGGTGYANTILIFQLGGDPTDISTSTKSDYTLQVSIGAQILIHSTSTTTQVISTSSPQMPTLAAITPYVVNISGAKSNEPVYMRTVQLDRSVTAATTSAITTSSGSALIRGVGITGTTLVVQVGGDPLDLSTTLKWDYFGEFPLGVLHPPQIIDIVVPSPTVTSSSTQTSALPPVSPKPSPIPPLVTPTTTPTQTLAAPVITGISGFNSSTGQYPDSNHVIAGTYLVLYGTFGTSTPTAMIDASPAQISYSSNTQINISLASLNLTATTHQVLVTTPGGSSSGRFTVVLPVSSPTVTQPIGSVTGTWSFGNWTTCSNGTHSRTVTCVDASGNSLDPSICDQSLKPAATEACVQGSYCGPAAGVPSATQPNLSQGCAPGYTTLSADVDYTTLSWKWLCQAPGTYQLCTAPDTGPVNAVCGRGQYYTNGAQPVAADLCYLGTGSTPVSNGNGTWSWTCNGIQGGAAATCSSNLPVSVAPTTTGTLSQVASALQALENILSGLSTK